MRDRRNSTKEADARLDAVDVALRTVEPHATAPSQVLQFHAADPPPHKSPVSAMSSPVASTESSDDRSRPRYRARVAFKTARGRSVVGKAEYILQRPKYKKYLDHKVDLIFTSPPFPLNRKKKYGNEQGEQYVTWLASFAPLFKTVLKPLGSVFLELGNAWEPGRPVMSTLALKALLTFLERGNFVLCQQFVWHNPARLPSPAQWVNVERIRVKDSYTHLWWMALTDRPHADNRRILTKYSDSMEKLLSRQRYNTGRRPSEHHIGKTSFLTNNSGAIPSNLITLSNTQAHSHYLAYCRAHDLQPHPARMPPGLADFFIKFLTTPDMLVLDPFAGSNTTGAAAESLGRRWFSIEPTESYVDGSRGRFAQFQ